jgi:microcystin degradation protein MlrC
MLRIGIGGFFHESNTFVRPYTTLADYERTRLYARADMLDPMRDTDTEIGGFLAGAEEYGFEAVATYYAWAWPAGPLTDDCFQTILERLKDAVSNCGQLDGMLLQVHGAMVAESDDDPDGTIIAEVRSCLPLGCPLIVSFDLHANLSPLMVSSCDALIGYQTYPHVDLNARGRDAAALMVRTLRGEVRPTMALAKPPLMPHIVQQRTVSGPMAEMAALAREAERQSGVVSVTVAAGFAYADVARMGMGIVAVTDGDDVLAAEIAQSLSDEAWARREAFTTVLPDAKKAVQEAVSSPRGGGPVVLADLADNVGGGAPGDGTVLLAELLAQKAEGAVVVLADAKAVECCVRAGVRERVNLRVGGKTDGMHGAPISVAGRVRALTDGIFRNIGPMRDGLVDDMGRTAVLDVDGLLLVLTERKLPQWNLEQLRSVGIEPSRQRIIVCKGAIAHRAAYEPIASRLIEVETPGSCAGDVRRFEYRNVRRPLFPLDRW